MSSLGRWKDTTGLSAWQTSSERSNRGALHPSCHSSPRANRKPTTQTILSPTATTGIKPLAPTGILASTKRSCSFFRPWDIPHGSIRSPSCQWRTASSRPTPGASPRASPQISSSTARTPGARRRRSGRRPGAAHSAVSLSPISGISTDPGIRHDRDQASIWGRSCSRSIRSCTPCSPNSTRPPGTATAPGAPANSPPISCSHARLDQPQTRRSPNRDRTHTRAASGSAGAVVSRATASSSACSIAVARALSRSRRSAVPRAAASSSGNSLPLSQLRTQIVSALVASSRHAHPRSVTSRSIAERSTHQSGRAIRNPSRESISFIPARPRRPPPRSIASSTPSRRSSA